MTANATHPGRVTIPGTDVGVKGTLIAEPQTTNMLLALDDRLALGPVKVDTNPSGTLETPGLVVPIVSGVLWLLRFEPHRHDVPPFALGVYNLNTSGVDLKDLVVTEVSGITETDRLNIAAAAAIGATNDSATASFVNNDASLTRAALTRTGKKPVGQGELVLNAADYGIVGDTTVQSMTALNAAITATAGKGVTVYFPPPSGAYYNLQQSIPNINNVTIRGDGHGTILRWTSGSLLVSTGNLTGWAIEDICIENLGAACGHIMDFGTTGGLQHASFRRVEFKPREPTTSIFYQNGSGNTFNMRFWDCKLWRMPTHLVPAIDLRSSNTGCSAISFYGGQWHSLNCNVGPFARFESTLANSYIGGLTFRDILGEQNLGGMIHCYGVSRAVVDNVMDYDGLTNTYTDDIFKFDVAAVGSQCYGVLFENSGTTGVPVMASGKVTLRITGGNYHRVGRINSAGGPTGTAALPTNGVVMLNGGGPAWSMNVRTFSYSALHADYFLVGNGTNLTFTLPDPTAPLQGGPVVVGRVYVAKNVHATPLTVVSAGTATIDGAANKVLATGDVVTFTTDGTNWLTVGSSRGPTVQTLATIGTLTVNTDLYTKVKLTAQGSALTIANPTGTPAAMQSLIIRVKDNGTARTIGYGGQFRAVGVTLPTTTVVNKTLYLGFMWNPDDTTWDCVSVAQQA